MATKRVLISIDADLLERIDSVAKRAGATRSGYLRQLAEADLSSAQSPNDAMRSESANHVQPEVSGRNAPNAPRRSR